MGRNAFINELRDEMNEEPEEFLHGATKKKTKINKFEQDLEDLENEHY
jgi:hypothetical protein